MNRSSILKEIYLRNHRQIEMSSLLMDSGSYQELQELELELYTTIAPFLKNTGQIQRSNAPVQVTLVLYGKKVYLRKFY